MRKNINSEHIEGRIYQHDLSIRTVNNPSSQNNGKSYIAGTLEVAVDDAGLNVIPVHFTFVTEVNNSGNKNRTYEVLSKIINEERTWVKVGPEDAFKVKVDTALALNDFYTQNNELVSVKTNEGGFVTIVNELAPENERNTFNTDMVITNVRRIEKDEEKDIKEDYGIVKGAVFNFRNDILPVEFMIKNPEGLAYFEDLEVSNSNPVYTRVWGKIECLTKNVEIKEESAFGEPSIRTYKRSSKEWIISGTSKVPYDFGEEGILTADELTKAVQDREVMLAEVKKRTEDYRASKNAAVSSMATTPKPSATIKTGDFNF